jgi:hypothetical protein
MGRPGVTRGPRFFCARSRCLTLRETLLRTTAFAHQQAVQERRRRGLDIAEVAFYSVAVLGIMLLSVYVPA